MAKKISQLGAIAGVGLDATGVLFGVTYGTGSYQLSADELHQVQFTQLSGNNVLLGDGSVGAPALGWTSDGDGTGTGFFRPGANQVGTAIDGVNSSTLTATGLQFGSGVGLLWSSTASGTGTIDVSLVREGADTLALRRESNPQSLRLYNTYSNGGSYEAGFMTWNTNILDIGTERVGGATRNMQFSIDGSAAMTISPTVITANLDIIGNGNIRAGDIDDFYWQNRSRMSSPSDGNVLLTRQSGSEFDFLQFGGTTSSYPAIKTSGTSLEITLADDSAKTDIGVNDIVFYNGAVDASRIGAGDNSDFRVMNDAGSTTWLRVNAGLMGMPTGIQFGWTNSNNGLGQLHTKFVREADGVVGLRRATSGQSSSLHLYNSYSSDAIYERGFFRWDTDVFEIGTEHLGGTGRDLEFKAGGVTRLTINEFGRVRVAADLWANAEIQFSDSTTLEAPSDGILTITNNDNTDFDRLQFGGTTSAYPALKKVSSSGLAVRLANDSGAGELTVGNLITDNFSAGVLLAGSGASSGVYWNSTTGATDPAIQQSGPNLNFTLADGSSRTSIDGVENVVFYNGNNNASRIGAGDNSDFRIMNNTGGNVWVRVNQGVMAMPTGLQIGWTNSDQGTGALHTKLVREADGVVGLRRAASGQSSALHLYNSYSSDSIYERGFFRWDTDDFVIGTEHVGGAARNIVLSTDGTAEITISSFVTIASTLVMNGVIRMYANGQYQWDQRAKMSAGIGVIILEDWVGTDFDRLCFGGNDSNYPALARRGTELHARLADDTADAAIRGDSVYVNASGAIGFASGIEASGTVDTQLIRTGVGTLAQRSGTTPQGFRLERSYVDGANNCGVELGFDGVNFELNYTGLGTETAADLWISRNGVVKIDIDSNLTYNSQDFELSTGSRLRWRNRSRIRSEADGNLSLYNNGATDFGMLQFGGITSSFPALKKVSASGIATRLADDSAFAEIQGKLKTDTAAVSGAVTATHYLTLYDASGVAYKVPAEAV